eukprot:3289405-Pleurochrysis_carterae.AAC.3
MAVRSSQHRLQAGLEVAVTRAHATRERHASLLGCCSPRSPHHRLQHLPVPKHARSGARFARSTPAHAPAHSPAAPPIPCDHRRLPVRLPRRQEAVWRQM